MKKYENNESIYINIFSDFAKLGKIEVNISAFI